MEKDEIKIDENLTKGLFVEEETSETASAPIPVPAPMPAKSAEKVAMKFTSEDILNLVCSRDENGYSPSLINATIQKIHNVNDNTDIDNIPEEDVEYVDDIVIQNCRVEVYSLNSNIVNLRLEFDTRNDAYLRELNEMLNRYRAMQESVTEDSNGNMTVPMFGISFMPEALEGHGIMKAFSPIAYFKTLNDDNESTVMHLLFDSEGLDFAQIELSEEEMSEIEADVLRELENSTGGNLF